MTSRGQVKRQIAAIKQAVLPKGNKTIWAVLWSPPTEGETGDNWVLCCRMKPYRNIVCRRDEYKQFIEAAARAHQQS